MERKPANTMVKRAIIPVSPYSRQSCEATNRNVIEAPREPEVSYRWIAKPFPTDSKGI